MSNSRLEAICGLEAVYGDDGNFPVPLDPSAPVRQVGPQLIISKSPAAPIPPPMHMVTMPHLAFLRRPSIRIWPASRAPVIP